MLIGQMAIVVTVLGWLLFVVLTLTRSSIGGAPDRPPLDVATIGYLVIMSLLACSALAYLTTRLGYYSRTRSHRRATRAELTQPFERSAPSLTVLIPSYQEDESVNRMTLLSAALQEYPDLEVVLLIDDPPEPRYATPAAMLAAAQRLPGEIEALLSEPMTRFQRALDDFHTRFMSSAETRVADVEHVGAEYEYAAGWLAAYASGYDVVDHADQFLVDQVLGGLSEDLTTNADALRAAALDGAALSRDHLRFLLQRLTWIFGARITHFQRKRFVSLSHEPNKAMNLNSYLGLMGGSYREVVVPGGGRALLRTDTLPDLEVRDPDYVLTLDADSLLLPEYCLRIRQPPPAGGARARRGRPSPVHRLPRRGHPPGADRRRDDRPAAHGPPGDDALRRHLLGRRERHPAQACHRRPARGDARRRLGDQPLHPGPNRHRGHGVEHRPRRPRVAAAQLPRAAELQRHAAGLRLAVHPAPALGQRRPADPAAPVAPDPRAPRPR